MKYRFLIVLVILLTACSSDPSCEQNTESLLRIDLYDYETKAAKEAEELTVYGLGHMDSLLYDHSKNESEILLPLDPAARGTSFVIQIGAETDTLNVAHSSSLYYISKTCGYSYVFLMDTAYLTGSLSDSMVIRRKDIDLNYVQNIRLYY